MKTLEKIKFWGDHHHPKWLAYLRILLGLILIWKGIAFILNMDVLANFLRETGLSDRIGISVSITLLCQLVIAFHLIGGFCIALGSHTRLFCLLNLPVLIGAVLLVDLHKNILKPYAEWWLAVFVLLGLLCFLLEGDGALATGTEAENTV